MGDHLEKKKKQRKGKTNNKYCRVDKVQAPRQLPLNFNPT